MLVPSVRRLVILSIAALSLLAGCGGTPPPAPLAGPGCIGRFDPGTDYFPVRTQFDHATNVTLTYERSYRVLTVKQPFPGGAPESYVLLQCGAPKPRAAAGAGLGTGDRDPGPQPVLRLHHPAADASPTSVPSTS